MSPQATVESVGSVESVSKRVAANRRNALRSTGPRSAEGKDRSRRNALRSGLAARTVLPEEIRLEAERRVEDWTASRRPQDEVERDLVVRGANAMTLLDRCWRELEAARLRGAAHAEGFWERERRAEVVELAKKLKTAPESTAAKLRLSLQGAEWMTERWAELGGRLERGCDWTAAQRSTALDLMGVRPEFRDDQTVVDLPGAEPQALIAHRLEIVLAEIDSLEADVKAFLEESDEIDREIRMKHLVVGFDADVRRLERYERQLDSRVHACLKMLRELQEGRAAEASKRPESKPKPEQSPKPNPPTPAPAPTPPRPSEVRRPPELGGPESLDFVLPSVPPVEPPRPRGPFRTPPPPEVVARIVHALELDAQTPFLSPADRAEALAMLEMIRSLQAPPSD